MFEVCFSSIYFVYSYIAKGYLRTYPQIEKVDFGIFLLY